MFARKNILSRGLAQLLLISLLLPAGPVFAWTPPARPAGAPSLAERGLAKVGDALTEIGLPEFGEDLSRQAQVWLARTQQSPPAEAASAALPPAQAAPEKAPLTDLPEGDLPPLPQPPGATVAPISAENQLAAPDSPTAETQAAVALAPAFNLASINWQPTNVPPAAVLAPVAAAVRKVYAYDACDSVDPWKIYDPASPASSDLTAITPKIGFWLEANARVTLPEAGPVPSSVAIPLCVGWNLIGFPKASARPVADALSSIAGKYLRVFGFDPDDVVDPWEVYDVAVPAWANDLAMLQPGRGYWIYIVEATTLTFSNLDDLPTVEILAPVDTAPVVAQTQVIGTVRSPALADWTLAQREVGTSAWIPIAGGTTPVEAAALGVFDPTLLENGLYELRLQAFDVNGNGVSDTITVAVEGQRKIGQFQISFVDLEIEMAGIPIQVVRTYDSRRKDKLGDFGYGWYLDISQGAYRTNGPVGIGWEITTGIVVGDDGAAIPLPCVTKTELRAHTATVRFSDREFYRFRPKLVDPAISIGGCFARVEFEFVDGPEPGARLEFLGGNEVFWGNAGSDLLDVNQLVLFDPPGVRLTTRDGRVFEVDKASGLRKVKDANNNQLTITAGAISHSQGLAITLERDSQGRISRVLDPEGEDRSYTYDTANDLVGAIDFENAVTSFGYRSHYLETIVDPLGRTPIRNEYGPDGRLTKHVDAFGREIVYQHRLADNQELVTNRLGKSRLLEYDDRGNVTREVNEEGEETLRTYDVNDNLLTERDPLGNITRNVYTNRNLVSTTDALGNVTRLTYNGRGDLLTLTDPRGNVTTNVYDTKGNLIRSTDAQGQVSTFIYDALGRTTAETDALGNLTRTTYESIGPLGLERVTTVDPLGNSMQVTKDLKRRVAQERQQRTLPDGTIEVATTRYVYDRQDRQIQTIAADGSVLRSEYDASGQVVAAVDPLGRRLTFMYDDLGRQIKTTFADGSFEEKVYDAENRVLESKDRLGRTTTYTYDDTGRLVSTLNPDTTSTSSVFDAAGRLTSATDARGATTTYEYDRVGRRTKIIDALGQITEFSFDGAGNQISVKDPKGQVTAFIYDSLNRQVRTVFPDGSDQRTGYDALGRRASETDQAGKTTHFGYDALGRLSSVTDALGQITRYDYDGVGNRTGQIDARGNVTRFEFDILGRQTKRILPGGAAERFTYDLAGRMTSRTDFRGVITLYDYDNLDRLTRRAYPNGEEVRFTYSPTGRRASAVDARGTTLYSYDDRDRLSVLTYPDGRALEFAYDPNGNRRSLKAQVGSSIYETQFTYDALNRLQTVVDPEGRNTVHDYDPNGNRESLAHANGVVTTYSYDSLNRLKDITAVANGGTIVANFNYMLGPAGNRTRIVELDGTTKNYTYDDLYRLTNETVTLGAAPRWSNSFVYDPVGNRQTQNRVEIGGGTRNVAYTYDNRDRLTVEDTVNYGWDQNGNLISKSGPEGATYEWDFENRLKQVTLADGTTVAHIYDVDGTRVRTVTTSPGGPAQVVEYLVYTSGWLSQVVLEGSSTSSVSSYYVRGDDLISVIRPQADAPSEVKYYHADGLGSIRALTDSAGVVTDTWQFEAFGTVVAHTGSDPNAYLFAGEMLDPNVGFAYHRARWLDPSVGRFGSMDPFAGSTGDPISLHKYLYAAGSPADRVDPTGLFSTAELSIANSIRGIITEIQIDVGITVLTSEPLDPDGELSKTLLLASLATGGLSLLKNWKAIATAFKQIGKGASGVAKRFFKRLQSWARRADMSWPNGIPAREGLEMAADWRQALGLAANKRNVAIAEVRVNGRKNLLYSLSGEGSPPGSVTAPIDRRFSTRTVRGAAPTENHSEVKILEYLAGELPQNSSGQISLYTERAPCPSCGWPDPLGVIEQFQQAFPGIRVVVTSSN